MTIKTKYDIEDQVKIHGRNYGTVVAEIERISIHKRGAVRYHCIYLYGGPCGEWLKADVWEEDVIGK